MSLMVQVQQVRQLRENLGNELCKVDKRIAEKTEEIFHAFDYSWRRLVERMDIESGARALEQYLLSFLGNGGDEQLALRDRVLEVASDIALIENTTNPLRQFCSLMRETNVVLHEFSIPEEFGIDAVGRLDRICFVGEILQHLGATLSDFSQPTLFGHLLQVGSLLLEFADDPVNLPLIAEIAEIFKEIARYQSEKEQLLSKRAQATKKFIVLSAPKRRNLL